MDATLDDTALRPTILVVDDTPDNITLISGLLRDRYRIKVATGGVRALRIAAGDPPPDLILLDVMMPEMDGYEVCRRLKADPATRDIPVVFLTARTEVEDERLGLELGAVDYITKPISPPIMVARVKTHLHLKAARDFLSDKNAFLEAEVVRRTQEVAAVQDVTIHAMASLAETRDNETGNHIRRTQNYVRALADALRDHPRFRHVLAEDGAADLLYKSAPLHDIGKVGIPDRILLKPGRLDDDEWETMKTHAILGYHSILAAEKRIAMPQQFLRFAREITLGHHERWDGTGYPQGIRGDAIPVSARLMAVADVYDALISRRVYKPPFSQDRAFRILEEGRGSHFDPDVCDTALALRDRFTAIADTFADSEHDLEIENARARHDLGE